MSLTHSLIYAKGLLYASSICSASYSLSLLISTTLLSPILTSFSTLFIFSYIILNGSTRFRKKISYLNKDLEKMVDAGASRIGTSAGLEIIKGEKADTDY